jgi:hypothetical protein
LAGDVVPLLAEESLATQASALLQALAARASASVSAHVQVMAAVFESLGKGAKLSKPELRIAALQVRTRHSLSATTNTFL